MPEPVFTSPRNDELTEKGELLVSADLARFHAEEVAGLLKESRPERVQELAIQLAYTTRNLAEVVKKLVERL
jgi:hypothetical protein